MATADFLRRQGKAYVVGEGALIHERLYKAGFYHYRCEPDFCHRWRDPLLQLGHDA